MNDIPSQHLIVHCLGHTDNYFRIAILFTINIFCWYMNMSLNYAICNISSHNLVNFIDSINFKMNIYHDSGICTPHHVIMSVNAVRYQTINKNLTTIVVNLYVLL